MVLNRKKPIRSNDKRPLRDPTKLGDESTLVFPRPNMFDDRIAIANVKLTIVKGQLRVGRDGGKPHAGIRITYHLGLCVSEPSAHQPLTMWVELLQHIGPRVGNIEGDAYVDHTGLCRWPHFLHEKSQNFKAGPERKVAELASMQVIDSIVVVHRNLFRALPFRLRHLKFRMADKKMPNHRLECFRMRRGVLCVHSWNND